MNSRQLQKLGVPEWCVPTAIAAVQAASADPSIDNKSIKRAIPKIIAAPGEFAEHPVWGGLARQLVAEKDFSPPEPVDYQTWGEAGIDSGTHTQMQQACAVPVAYRGALMPDAHIGYGLPIGGVLAVKGAVIPYAVGVDIACRMKLSVLDLPPASLDQQRSRYTAALEGGTRFGVGVEHEKLQMHDVLDADWSVSRITRESKDKAWRQLGTSGSGNHFVEFGLMTLPEDDAELGLAAGQYVALLSHSGSRGPGAAVCSTYSAIAQRLLPARWKEFGRLAWLDLDSQPGQEYWAAMNLMGDYAAANHDVIHRLVSRLLGAEIVAGVENHHNFAWKEVHDGEELIVHRKGATPAAAGELGVIPGSMADPAFVVRGRGNPASLASASHGAGRRMSRTQARNQYNFRATQKSLAERGITVLSAGADEVPGVYKNIEEVMREQSDLVETVARFDPRIVKMCGDGSRAED